MPNIKGHCISDDNTRDAREVWPTTFVMHPRVGDLVRAQSGKTLAIRSITHCTIRVRKAENINGIDKFSGQTVARIELRLGRAQHA